MIKKINLIMCILILFVSFNCFIAIIYSSILNHHYNKDKNISYEIREYKNKYQVIDKRSNEVIYSSNNKLIYEAKSSYIINESGIKIARMLFDVESELVIIDKGKVVNYYDNEKTITYYLDESNKRNGRHYKDKKKEVIEFENIDFIYQNTKDFEKIQCDKNGQYLTKTLNYHGCMIFNFIMVNNSEKNKKLDANELLDNGYDCHFNYQKAAIDYNYSQYELIDLKNEYTSKLDYEFDNKNSIVTNSKETFNIKDYLLNNELPLMIWVIPKGDKKLNNGHLITVYKYVKNNNEEKYYFYDSYNKNEPTRNLNDFMKRWEIANVHALKQ